METLQILIGYKDKNCIIARWYYGIIERFENIEKENMEAMYMIIG